MLTFALNYAYTRRIAVLGRKPVLVFEYDGRRGWILRNVGAGPALNVIVAQKQVDGKGTGKWFDFVRVPPLAKDGEVLLEWLEDVNDTGLGATYSDVAALQYSSKCGNDLTTIYNNTLFSPTREDQVVAQWKRVERAARGTH